MIVDLDQGPRRRTALRPPLMAAAIGVLMIGFGALVVRPAADPAESSQARERLAAALVIPSATAAPTLASVRIPPPIPLLPLPRVPLPAPLTFPAGVAATLPAESPDASRASVLAVGDASRQIAYRLPDGRTVVLRQSAGLNRPVLASYQLDEGSVRGYPAQFVTTRTKSLRSLISWSEGGASYLLYSGSLTVRDLVRLAEQLR